MNTPISFLIAKLLKEKGFNEIVKTAYLFNSEKANVPNGEFSNNGVKYISAPTIAEVVMWLYEKYGIWIQVFILNKTFAWKVEEIKKEITWCLFSQQDKGYNLPTEAYEAAIEYSLENLI